jgi:hypothetical protein
VTEWRLATIFAAGHVEDLPAEGLPDSIPFFDELPEEVQADYRRQYEEIKHLVVFGKSKSRWTQLSLTHRKEILADALACLEAGRLETLRQAIFKDYPEVKKLDPRFEEAMDSLKDKPLAKLSAWDLLRPSTQEFYLKGGIRFPEGGDFYFLERRLKEYPEMSALDPRIRDFGKYLEENPAARGQKRPKLKWKELSEESQALILRDALVAVQNREEGDREQLLKGALKNFPELRKADPVLLACWESRKSAEDERWDSGASLWKDLGEDLQKEAVADCLEQLDAGNVGYVEDELEKLLELRKQDARLMEVWKAMKKREKG